LADPTRLLHRDVVEHPALLTGELEINPPVFFDLVYEFVAAKALRVVAAARETPEQRPLAGVAERRAEVADGVAKFRPVARGHGQQHVVLVLRVPVVQEHHQHLQPL
jgi:hypothetical protein